ncbi:kinase-like domain-containing protein [Suillus bovinus]|uniref:kinase-like domain-containing protein n=1 Tax=Suillus bovinus TaxID=48563 RepID=UPI001B86FBC3|nr:kinase-like domain-containing protein [Suillus bovinus]KAG2146135.1 kinase-like domain-containing protein [Suillus bovinus]
MTDQHRRRSLRSTAQRHQHPYRDTRPLRVAREKSNFGTDTGVEGPLAVDQRRFTGTLEPSTLTTPDVAPSITPISIPDLTSLIKRRSQYPISGGAYGDVYHCTYHGPEGDEEVAVKAIRPQYFNTEMFRRELGIWKRLRHSNILKFMGTTSDFGPSKALVAPWMKNGTLTSFLRENESLRLHDRLLLLRDVAAGLNYLHTFSLTEDGHTDLNPIVHGDLTGTNVLIDGDRKAYLADFGLSGTFEKLAGMTYLAKRSCHPGAMRWTAPELLSGEESASAATTRSDMYSFGSIMLQVLTGDIPWCHLTKDNAVVAASRLMGNASSPIDRPPAEEAVQFVNSILCTSPQTSTSSISSDERHPVIARDDYLRGDTDARLPVMQDIDSPLDDQENYSTIYGLEPSWMSYVFQDIPPEYLLPQHINNIQHDWSEANFGVGPHFNDQEPSEISLSVDYTSLSTIAIDHTSRNTIWSNIFGNTDARLPVMQDIDSPLDTRENYPGVMLPAYPSTTYSLEQSWTQSNLPRPYTSGFSPTYHARFADEDKNNVTIPSGYRLPQHINNVQYNWFNLNMQQNASLQHYMQHVLRIQYLHVDGSIDKLIWNLIHSSDSAREAACLLADLHRKSTQGAIGAIAPAFRNSSDAGKISKLS